MANVSYDYILNHSPKKRLMIGYNKLKENFTMEAAEEYSALYKDQPLSFILENSRMIFSEPYYGRNFYKQVFEHAVEYPFVFVESGELDKVSEYMETYGEKLSDQQKAEYQELKNLMEETLAKVPGLVFIESVGSSMDHDRIVQISDALYQKNVDDVVTEFTAMESPDSILAFAPAVYRCTLDAALVRNCINKVYTESSGDISEDEMAQFTEASMIASRLCHDKEFANHIVTVLPRPIRSIYEGLAMENVMDHIADMRTVTMTELPASAVTPFHAVNGIFNNLMMEFAQDELLEKKRHNDIIDACVYGKIAMQIYHEYTHAKDTTDLLVGYPFFENTSIEDALQIVMEKDMQYNNGKASRIVSQHSTSLREGDNGQQSKKANASSPKRSSDDFDDDDIDFSDYDSTDSKPKKKDLATKIQHKAMDAEAKQMKKMAMNKEKGQKVLGAAKAVVNIPMNIVNSIKQAAHEFDVADDDRRKKYIIEPGFRKKWLRNLKLALMYGATASCNLSMVPVLAICRHYSKEKDKRIRTELAKELETEIRICEEKISDAGADGNQKEKYQLMRIKSQLETEALRVKINSKYV